MDGPAKAEELAKEKEPAAETEAPRASRALEKSVDGVLYVRMHVAAVTPLV